MKERVFYESCQTDIGELELYASEKGLCYVGLPGNKKAGREYVSRKYGVEAESAGNRFTRQAAGEIKEYLAGKLKNFTVSLDLRADGFSREALMRVKRIPFGQTATYGEIAKKLDKPAAARAVGQANARNPLPLVIPCHRVVASTGLGGYGGGLNLKKRLLALEQIKSR